MVLFACVDTLHPSQQFSFMVFGCVDTLHPSEHYSVMCGRFPVFLGWISTKHMSCSRTQHSDSVESRALQSQVYQSTTEPLQFSMMGIFARKPVFGVSFKQVSNRSPQLQRLSRKIEISSVPSLHMQLSKTRITKVLIRLRECAGWSGPVLFANPWRQVFSQQSTYGFECYLFPKGKNHRIFSLPNTIWSSAWDFQQCDILTCVDSDEPLQPPFKLRNSKWCSVHSFGFVKYVLNLYIPVNTNIVRSGWRWSVHLTTLFS